MHFGGASVSIEPPTQGPYRYAYGGATAARAALLILLLGSPARAQEAKAPEVGFSSIPFQFFPPGARSLGMGATFVGVADDATAAASNPAGLVILTKPEASVHGRFSHFEELADSGYTSPASSDTSLSYASLVVPLKPASFSVYYQQVSNFDIERQFAGNVLFQSGQGPSSFSSTSQIDILVEDLGFSGALKLGKRLSIGATLARRRLSFTYLNTNVIGALDLTDQASADQQSDDQLVFNSGLLINPNGKLSLGFVFKKGGEFQIPYVVDYEDSLRGPAACPQPDPFCTAGAIHIPDTWAAGAGFRPSARWLFAIDAALLRYSQLSPTVFRSIPYDIYPPLTTELLRTEFSDVVQLNGGFERIFPGRPTVGLRGGFFHRPNFNKDGTLDAGATFGTVGLGLVFGDRGQLDMAASFSKNTSEGLVSLVIRF